MSKDITGNKYGKLTAISFYGKSPSGSRRWLCRCDCGVHIVVHAGNLAGHRTTSCGCLQSKAKFLTNEYRAWRSLRKHSKPKMCERWLNFSLFLKDMGKCPPDKRWIIRSNKKRNYTPSNCKWGSRGK